MKEIKNNNNINNISNFKELLVKDEMTNIKLEKCRHLDNNLLNEIIEYKQSVEKFLFFKDEDNNMRYYVSLYCWLIFNKKEIIMKLEDVLEKLYHDQKYAEKENVWLDDYVNPDQLLEDITIIKKEMYIIGYYLEKVIHKKFYVSIEKNKQFMNIFIDLNLNKKKITESLSHTSNDFKSSLCIMTLFSGFSNYTDKYYYLILKNWVEKNDLYKGLKRKILDEISLKSRTLDFKTNTKILFGKNDELLSFFYKLMLINTKNYSDLDFYLKQNILEVLLKLMESGIYSVVFVSNDSENYEYLISMSGKKSNVSLKNKFRYKKNFVIKFTSLENLIDETRNGLFYESITEESKLEDILNISHINDLYSKSIFIFLNMDWNNIVYRFKQNKISISSGMNNRKGMLSPLEFKFTNLLVRLFDENKAYSLIKYSNLYHKTLKKSSEKKLGKVVEEVSYNKPLTVNEYYFDLKEALEKFKLNELEQGIRESLENIQKYDYEIGMLYDEVYEESQDDAELDVSPKAKAISKNYESLESQEHVLTAAPEPEGLNKDIELVSGLRSETFPNLPFPNLEGGMVVGRESISKSLKENQNIECISAQHLCTDTKLESVRSSKSNYDQKSNLKSNNTNPSKGSSFKKYHTLINQRPLFTKGWRDYSILSGSLNSYEINNDNKSASAENEITLSSAVRLGEDKSSNKESNNLSKYMENLRLLLNNKEMSWEEKQILLEKEWLSYGTDLDLKDEKVKKELLSKTSFSYYIVRAAETLQLKMEDGSIKKRFGKKSKKGVLNSGHPSAQINEYYPYLNKIKNLWITVSIATTLYSRKNITWTNASSIIGTRILEHIWWDICDDPNFLDSDIVKKEKIIINKEQLDAIKVSYKKVFFKMKHFSYEDFLIFFSIENENLEAVKIGDFFLEMFSNVPHILFERVPLMLYENNADRVSLTLTVKDEIFDDIKRNLIPNNFTVPMVYKPLDWSENEKGGQLLMSKTSKYSIITGNNKQDHKTLNREKLYNTVNILNSKEFIVNSDLLDYLETSEGQNFINKEMMTKDKSELIQFKYTWDLAKTFHKVKFFLTVKGDWRGRLYVTPFFLNYQGSEFNKSLVYMANGEKLNDKGYEKLCIYGATLFNEGNMSKKKDNLKLEWTKNNLDKICKIDFDFIQKAESKWLFLAFSLVMKKYREDNNCIVNFPIYIDATCSGIQHVAAMIEDLDLARSVNLITEEDQVRDIYTELLSPINEEIRWVGLNDVNYPNLKYTVLTRKETKPGVMTKTYNVSLRGMLEQLISVASKKFWKKEWDDKSLSEINKLYIVLPYKGSDVEIHLSLKDVYKIAQIIEKNIFIKYNSLEIVYNYFKDICKVMNSLNLPVSWVTPSGLVVTQHYLKTEEKKYSFYFGGSNKSLILREKQDKMDKRGQVNAIIPNIIHSLDASHLMNVIISANDKKINYVLPVHDCFGTHPNHVDKLFDLLKLEFVKLYANEEFLSKFHNNIKQSIINNQGYFVIKNKVEKVTMSGLNRTFYFPLKPKVGVLNLKDILESKYMFI